MLNYTYVNGFSQRTDGQLTLNLHCVFITLDRISELLLDFE